MFSCDFPILSLENNLQDLNDFKYQLGSTQLFLNGTFNKFLNFQKTIFIKLIVYFISQTNYQGKMCHTANYINALWHHKYVDGYLTPQNKSHVNQLLSVWSDKKYEENCCENLKV